MTRILAARLDNVGDVVLTGPAVRALAADAEVVFLSSPAGRRAAELLPGVERVLTFAAPWILADPPPVDPRAFDELVAELRSLRLDEAVVFTSFHQSPLPLALALRLAGVGRVAAISEDYPGSLLDVRHRVDDGLHEVERACSLAAAAGHPPEPSDDGRLRVEPGAAARERVRRDRRRRGVPEGAVVIHPGSSVPARTWAPDRFAALAAALGADGWPLVVTGGRHERALTATVAAAHPGAHDEGGRWSLDELAVALAEAPVVVAGNTGPAHLAAAVGTPVASLFPPTVPARRWRPWGVPHVLLGDQEIDCAGCRARVCPRLGHPCLDRVAVPDVVAAVERLAADPASLGARTGPPSLASGGVG